MNNYQIALTLLKGIGPKKAKLLLAKLDSIESIFSESLNYIAKQTGIGIQVLKQMDRASAIEKAKIYADYLKKNEIKSHFYLDKTYPRRLKQCDDAPLLLFSKGDMDLNTSKVVSVVGTRNATEYGRSVCEELIKGFVGKEIVVISGMAYGVDICIHQLCVKNNIQTIGVLGHGLDRLYPSIHKNIANRMLENGGLLTEFLPGTKPDKENFPMRNRIVAGMADATIVIESKDSGGSLITAELANEYSRDVFAFPGNVGQIYSKGCNQLIASQKAHLITDSTDFLKLMHWEEEIVNPIQTQLFQDFTKEEKMVLDLLSSENELNIDIISIKTVIPISKTNVLMFNLEMKGAVKALPGRMYKLI
ncbi:MAG: DNA-protecting protein DprA [Flavobacteriia bacterium]|nr:DNA-protecting protein DprA [Flavobacteriia bacterium]